MRTRRTKLRLSWVEARTGWRDSKLVFTDVSGNERKQAVINIDAPYELKEIRSQLDKIEDAWRKALDSLQS